MQSMVNESLRDRGIIIALIIFNWFGGWDAQAQTADVAAALQRYSAGRSPTSKTGEEVVQLVLKAGNSEVHYTLAGHLLVAMGDFRGAIDTLNKAIKINPAVDGPHIALSELYYRLALFDMFERGLCGIKPLPLSDAPAEAFNPTYLRVEILELVWDDRPRSYGALLRSQGIDESERSKVMIYVMSRAKGGSGAAAQQNIQQKMQKLDPPKALPIPECKPDRGTKNILEAALREMELAEQGPAMPRSAEYTVVDYETAKSLAARLRDILKDPVRDKLEREAFLKSWRGIWQDDKTLEFFATTHKVPADEKLLTFHPWNRYFVAMREQFTEAGGCTVPGIAVVHIPASKFYYLLTRIEGSGGRELVYSREQTKLTLSQHEVITIGNILRQASIYNFEKEDIYSYGNYIQDLAILLPARSKYVFLSPKQYYDYLLKIRQQEQKKPEVELATDATLQSITMVSDLPLKKRSERPTGPARAASTGVRGQDTGEAALSGQEERDIYSVFMVMSTILSGQFALRVNPGDSELSAAYGALVAHDLVSEYTGLRAERIESLVTKGANANWADGLLRAHSNLKLTTEKTRNLELTIPVVEEALGVKLRRISGLARPARSSSSHELAIKFLGQPQAAAPALLRWLRY